MACHYFSVLAKSLVAAQMHKMVFRHVSLLCTLGAVAAAAVLLRMFRSRANCVTRTLLCIPCGREPEKATSEDALTNGQK